MIDSVEGGTEVEKDQTSHVAIVSCHYHVRQNMQVTTVSVKWWWLYADSIGSSISVSDRWALMYTSTNFLNNFAILWRFEIGR